MSIRCTRGPEVLFVDLMNRLSWISAQERALWLAQWLHLGVEYEPSTTRRKCLPLPKFAPRKMESLRVQSLLWEIQSTFSLTMNPSMPLPSKACSITCPQSSLRSENPSVFFVLAANCISLSLVLRARRSAMPLTTHQAGCVGYSARKLKRCRRSMKPQLRAQD